MIENIRPDFVIDIAGDTFTIDPLETYYEYVISGSGAIAADNDVVIASPITNMVVRIRYVGSCTNAGGTVVVLGRALSDIELAHPQDITCTYTSAAWSVSVDTPNNVGAFDGQYIANGSIPAAALTVTPWLIDGNAGTTAGTNFLGTTDNVDVVFKRNSVQSGRIALANTSLGTSAGAAITSGTENVAIGDVALEFLTTGNNNTAIGTGALNANNGAGNTATGSAALTNNTTGGSNTADGLNALTANTTGNYNTAAGVQSLGNNTTGSSNTALGRNAGGANTTGSGNTSIGEGAGSSATNGTERIALGKSATPTKDYQFIIPLNITEVEFNKSNLRVGAITQNFTATTQNATGTLTGAQILSGLITSTSAAATAMTLPTGTDLGAALNAVRGTEHTFSIDNSAGASTVTVVVNTDAILSALAVANAASFGLLTIPSGVTGTSKWLVRFTTTTAYTITRIG